MFNRPQTLFTQEPAYGPTEYTLAIHETQLIQPLQLTQVLQTVVKSDRDTTTSRFSVQLTESFNPKFATSAMGDDTAHSFSGLSSFFGENSVNC